MFFWIFIMLLLILCLLGCLYYLGRCFAVFPILQHLSKGNKKRSHLLGIVMALLILVISSLTLNFMNGIVIMLHLMVFWFLFDMGSRLIGRIHFGKNRNSSASRFPSYFPGLLSIMTTIIYLCVGAYLAYHVAETDYTIVTTKKAAPLRIALIADSHTGTTYDGDGFARHLETIQETAPDVLLIAGDFVDEDTSIEDMVRSCEALSTFQCTYGVFYAFGNHDKGYYNTRGFSGDDLIRELQKNNVTVLQDESFSLNDDYVLIGRQDRSEDMRNEPRAAMKELMNSQHPEQFSIVLDHQPYDYDAEQEANVDLVLSGHTHGGQLIPINHVGVWTGANAKTYGLEKRGNTNFIVTSGISDWSLKFKTGCKSEFVIIDIVPENQSQNI